MRKEIGFKNFNSTKKNKENALNFFTGVKIKN